MSGAILVQTLRGSGGRWCDLNVERKQPLLDEQMHQGCGLGRYVGQGLGELAPGVPFGHLVGGQWDTVSVVTKAGGFGTPTTLLDVVRALMSKQDGGQA